MRVARALAPALLVLVAILPSLAQAQGNSPTAAFSYAPAQPLAGERVRFVDASADPDGDLAAWLWDFGDGTSSTSREPAHRFSEAGSFLVVLTATDAQGNADGASREVPVAAAPELAIHFPAWLYWAMPALVSTILVALGALVLTRGQPTIYNRVFFLLCLASATKGYTEGALFFLNDPDHAAAFPIQLVNVLITLVYAPIFLWFVLVFPRPVRPWLKAGIRGVWTLALALPFMFLYFFPIVSGGTFQAIFNVWASLLALGALALLVYHAWETDSPEERHRLRLLSTTFFLLVFSTIMVALLDLASERARHLGHITTAATYDELGNAFGTILAPVLEIIGLVLVMYAILRYQLLGVELLVKRITRTSLFALVVGTVFVVVSNSVEQLFQVTVLGGVRFDFILAGFISAGLMYPIQKLTERVAKRLFPHAGSTAPDYLAERRMEIYEAQLRYALLDGELREKELSMLEALRDSIGLLAPELDSVAQKFPGVDARVLHGRPRPLPA